LGNDDRRARVTSVSVARTASRIPADLFLALLDVFVILAAYTGLLLLRFDLDVPGQYWDRFAPFLAIAVCTHLVANRLWRTYGHIWEHASVEEARRLLAAGVSALFILLFTTTLPALRVPFSVVLIGPVLATILMGATRFQSRLFAFSRAKELVPGLRVAVVGAGAGGGAAVRQMRRDHLLGMTPVAVLDDNRKIRGRTLNGVPIVAGIDDH
jgi:FlaA1/EpsC-like NDP-sugar epimerase